MNQIGKDRLVTILRRFTERKLLIVGDAIADRFVYGTISRVSREAPVFILKHDQTETVPGGAANCAMNLACLGARVSLLAVAGNDEAGLTLKQRLRESKVDVEGLYTCDTLRTATKMRILAGQTHSSRQQVIRIDYDDNVRATSEMRSQMLGLLEVRLKEVDAVIISDYNYGTVDDSVLAMIRETTKTRGVPVLVDSRFKLKDFIGFTSATPNEEEVENVIGRQPTSLAELETAAEELRKELDYRALLVTRGGKGMMLLEDGSSPLHIPAVGTDQPVDVTGAGDTVIATFALSVSSAASYVEAAHLANYAGGLVVMKRGTACVTARELEHAILSSE